VARRWYCRKEVEIARFVGEECSRLEHEKKRGKGGPLKKQKKCFPKYTKEIGEQL